MSVQALVPNPNAADGQPVILGGVSVPDYINYAGPPVVNPPALQNIIVDINGRQWQYYNNAWH